MENTIYYTFSTIAQVLAAIVGIIGVFAIFHFQSLYDSLFGFATSFYEQASKNDLSKNVNFLNQFNRLKDVIQSKKRDELEPRMTDIVNSLYDRDDYLSLYQDLQVIQIRFAMLTQSIQQRKRTLKELFIYSLALILASIVILSFASIICPIIAYILFGVSIFFCSFCLYKVYQFVEDIIK